MAEAAGKRLELRKEKEHAAQVTGNFTRTGYRRLGDSQPRSASGKNATEDSEPLKLAARH